VLLVCIIFELGVVDSFGNVFRLFLIRFGNIFESFWDHSGFVRFRLWVVWGSFTGRSGSFGVALGLAVWLPPRAMLLLVICILFMCGILCESAKGT